MSIEKESTAKGTISIMSHHKAIEGHKQTIKRREKEIARLEKNIEELEKEIRESKEICSGFSFFNDPKDGWSE